MRLPGSDHDCGPLLELGHIRHQLGLGSPVDEGAATIAVADIIGTAGRVRDFDGGFHPLHAALKKRIEEIAEAKPSMLDEPIAVVRVDRAYFVTDGHKRVALAKREGREFIDAVVMHMPSPYALTRDVELEAIERTAREGEFRRHSGLMEGVPDARFALTDITAYGELLLAVQAYAYDRVTELRRWIAPAEAGRRWYEEKYLPGVESGRRAAAGRIDAMTDADVFLTVHRQERGAWGGECGDPECVADMLIADQRRLAVAARSPLDRVLHRAPRPANAPALLLPDADDLHPDRERPA